jgi:hypothetical protein
VRPVAFLAALISFPIRCAMTVLLLLRFMVNILSFASLCFDLSRDFNVE